jgi:hypothetical protein
MVAPSSHDGTHTHAHTHAHTSAAAQVHPQLDTCQQTLGLRSADTNSPLVFVKAKMLLFILEDEHGFIYEPHGIESCYWSTTPEGSDMLKAAGWKPYEMHRVSRHLHFVLIELGHLLGGRSP